jgi:hypothetical protein
VRFERKKMVFERDTHEDVYFTGPERAQEKGEKV